MYQLAQDIKTAPNAAGSEVNTGGINNPALGESLEDLLRTTDEPGVTFLQKAVPALITLGFVIAVVLFFGYLLWGAIEWIGSGGDKAAVEGARAKITNAIIGLVILFAIYAIIQVIEIFFGTNILSLDILELKIQ